MVQFKQIEVCREFAKIEKSQFEERKMNMKLLTFVIITLVIYMPFHLFEEALGNFPKWMYEHKWLPYHMTYGHWMSNNIFI